MILNILILALFTLYTLIVFPFLVVLWIFTVPFDSTRCAVQWYSRFWSKGIYMLRFRWRITFKGLENIDPDQAYLIVSNHQAMLDIPLLLHIKKNFRFVSKKEVYSIPIFGWVLWLRGDVAITRGGTSSAKKMVKDCNALLKKGLSITLFPEGTRTKNGEIGSFHSGGFLVAKMGRVPILPVVISGNYDAFNSKYAWKKREFTLSILPPVSAEVVSEMTMEELRDSVENLMKKEYTNICQK